MGAFVIGAGVGAFVTGTGVGDAVVASAHALTSLHSRPGPTRLNFLQQSSKVGKI